MGNIILYLERIFYIRAQFLLCLADTTSSSTVTASRYFNSSLPLLLKLVTFNLFLFFFIYYYYSILCFLSIQLSIFYIYTTPIPFYLRRGFSLNHYRKDVTFTNIYRVISKLVRTQRSPPQIYISQKLEYISLLVHSSHPESVT